MINFDQMMNVLKEEGIPLPDNELNETSLLSEQGIDSLTSADIFITLGEYYEVDLMEIDTNKLTSFKEIMKTISELKAE